MILSAKKTNRLSLTGIREKIVFFGSMQPFIRIRAEIFYKGAGFLICGLPPLPLRKFQHLPFLINDISTPIWFVILLKSPQTRLNSSIESHVLSEEDNRKK